VTLVHREDTYERESPRAGEADLIIAKAPRRPDRHRRRQVPGPLQQLQRHARVGVASAGIRQCISAAERGKPEPMSPEQMEKLFLSLA
jgi:hypothetical protein